MRLKAKLAGFFAANGLRWLAVLTLFLGLGYCSAAAFLLLAAHTSNALAALYTGLGTLALVLVPLWIISLRLKRSRPKANDAPPVQALLDTLLSDDNLEQWVKGNSKKAVLAALAAGILTGASPEARQGLMRLLEEFTSEE